MLHGDCVAFARTHLHPRAPLPHPHYTRDSVLLCTDAKGVLGGCRDAPDGMACAEQVYS